MLKFSNRMEFHSLKIVFILANRVDPDAMRHCIWIFTVFNITNKFNYESII